MRRTTGKEGGGGEELRRKVARGKAADVAREREGGEDGTAGRKADREGQRYVGERGGKAAVAAERSWKGGG